MSKFEEKKYKQTLINDTPDLWDRINNKLDSDLFTTDSAPNMDMKPNKDFSSIKKEKIKPSKVYKIAGIIAACLAIIILPITIYNSANRNVSLKSDSNSLFDLDKGVVQEDSISDSTLDSAPLDNSVTSNNSQKGESSSDNAHIGDHTSKEYANQNNDKTQNDSYNNNEGEIKLPSNDKLSESEGGSNKDEAGSFNGGGFTPKGEGGEHLKNGQLHFRIDSLHQDPKLGLIYKGTATASKDKTIAAECVFYLSLRELSKTDLSKKLKVGDKITITLKDTSYAACLDNPYYATSILYK